jgi:hypothetical protein
MICPHCDKPVFHMTKDRTRAKAKVTCLILHKAGDVEINCPECKRGILLPFHRAESGEMKKSQYPKHTVLKTIPKVETEKQETSRK